MRCYFWNIEKLKKRYGNLYNPRNKRIIDIIKSDEAYWTYPADYDLRSEKDPLLKNLNLEQKRIDQDLNGLFPHTLGVIIDASNNFVKFVYAVQCIGFIPEILTFSGENVDYKSFALDTDRMKEDFAPLSLRGGLLHQLYEGYFLLARALTLPMKELLRRSGLKKLFIAKSFRDIITEVLLEKNIAINSKFFDSLCREINNFPNSPDRMRALGCFVSAFRAWSQEPETEKSKACTEFEEVMKGLMGIK